LPKIAVVDNPSHLTPLTTGSLANICVHLIFPETRVTGLHFCHQ